MSNTFNVDDAVADYFASLKRSHEEHKRHERKMRRLRIASFATSFALGVIAGVTER